MLVEYSDSESGTEVTKKDVGEHVGSKSVSTKKRKLREDAEGSKKVKLPPPPPPSFFSLYATRTRASTSDDPELHGGRTRQVPHTEGNWPTHIYLEWFPSKAEAEALDAVITQVKDGTKTQVKSFLYSDLGVQQPLHVSLSAPLILRTEEKDQFGDAISNTISNSNIKKFAVSPTGIHWVSNSDRTRFFLVIGLSLPDADQLNKILDACNTCCSNFGLPRLYDHDKYANDSQKVAKRGGGDGSDGMPGFHISMAWSLGEAGNKEMAKINQIDVAHLLDMKIEFGTIKLKIGNTVKDIALDANA